MHATRAARPRREEYAEATHEALLDSASGSFFEYGFTGTSLDLVAQRARVTKGAIYHHFSSKRDLFLAVLERQQAASARSVAEAGAQAITAWEGIVAAFDAFLETISDPVYQRLCWVEGPAGLGFEAWWAFGERYEIGVIRSQLHRAAASGILEVKDVDMLAQVLFGAVTAGVLGMVRADDPMLERERFRSVMLEMIAGLVRFDPPA
jgi:AcrR family transcriptional regulator